MIIQNAHKHTHKTLTVTHVGDTRWGYINFVPFPGSLLLLQTFVWIKVTIAAVLFLLLVQLILSIVKKYYKN